MSISPPIHTDDLDTLPDNTELIEILTARYDTGVLLRYGTDGTLKNTKPGRSQHHRTNGRCRHQNQ